jgi:hypothetical protein
MQRHTLWLLLAGLILGGGGCDRQSPDSAGAQADESALTPRVIEVGSNDIAGVVTGPDGPEAGVWVIAETEDLPTRFARIVVTDDAGRFLVPDLPAASYRVWVRGYGLADSEAMTSLPGTRLALEAEAAASPAAAAQIYPAGYWYSLLELPDREDFPGTGPEGNGISPDIRHYEDWVRRIGNGSCLACHQLGNRATREIPELFSADRSSVEAWHRRVQAGQAGSGMLRILAGMGMERAVGEYAAWTDRIAAGTLPAEQPSRPNGIERNVVITQWDWADPKAYLHDLVSTDRRDPSVNAGGRLYGVLENSADYLPVLDPETHTTDRVTLTTLPGSDYDPEPAPVAGPSVYWGEEPIWDSATTAHNPMLDAEGRVWVTARVRDPEDSPDFCREGSEHPSAQAFPVERSYRHLGVYDTAAEEYTPIDTCFSTHHLMFAEDDNDTLWTSGGGDVVGWLNVAEYLKTGDAAAAQGWTPTVLDTNGNGRRDAGYTEPGESVDPTRDARIRAGFYGVAPSPDGSVWGSTLGYPGGLVRLVPGEDPARTAIAEYYEPPLNDDGSAVEGFSPRGMDIDRNGVAWAAMASGHMASFDRRLCQAPLNGPEATGQHCPEGWTFYPEPLPKFRNQQHAGSAEGSYYTWVDQFNTLGLGENTPINTGNLSEALLVLHEGDWVRLRVPYPLGFYTKWLDGRIDDPEAGWKGRGLWATFSSRAPFHMETGAGTTSKVYHFQLRPDPLAR